MTQSIGPGRIARIAHALAIAKRDGPNKLTERELVVFSQGDWAQIHRDLTELVQFLPKMQMYLRYKARRADFAKFSTEELYAYLEKLSPTQPPRMKSRIKQYTLYSDEYIVREIIQERLEADTQD